MEKYISLWNTASKTYISRVAQESKKLGATNQLQFAQGQDGSGGNSVVGWVSEWVVLYGMMVIWYGVDFAVCFIMICSFTTYCTLGGVGWMEWLLSAMAYMSGLDFTVRDVSLLFLPINCAYWYTAELTEPFRGQRWYEHGNDYKLGIESDIEKETKNTKW